MGQSKRDSYNISTRSGIQINRVSFTLEEIYKNDKYKFVQNIFGGNLTSKEEFLEAARKIHESETAPIRKPMDEGAPTIREVINNQKRLAKMMEYLAQIMEDKK